MLDKFENDDDKFFVVEEFQRWLLAEFVFDELHDFYTERVMELAKEQNISHEYIWQEYEAYRKIGDTYKESGKSLYDEKWDKMNEFDWYRERKDKK